MKTLDLAAGIEEAMKDPEFSREMRYFTGALKVVIDDKETVAVFDDGALVEVGDKHLDDADCQIWIRGTRDLWDGMLAEYPVPFFQCLQTTSIKHGLLLSATHQTFAYLPALNRLIALLRAQNVRTSS